MADLSPAAQAVLDAAVQAVIDACTNAPTYMNWATRYAAAAALRAAADQVVPAEVRVRKGMRPGGVGSTTPAEWMQDQRLHSRRKFLAIAAELGGTNNASQEDYKNG
jgi:hypothetical protein